MSSFIHLLGILFQSRVRWGGSFDSLALKSPDGLEIVEGAAAEHAELPRTSQSFTDLHVVTCYFGRETSGLSKRSWMLGPSSTKHPQV